MRKALGIITAVVLSTTMFVGCGKKESDSENKKEMTTEDISARSAEEIYSDFENIFNRYIDGESIIGTQFDDLLPSGYNYEEYFLSESGKNVSRDSSDSAFEIYGYDLGEHNSFADISFDQTYPIIASIKTDAKTGKIFDFRINIAYNKEGPVSGEYGIDENSVKLAKSIWTQICQRRGITYEEAIKKYNVSEILIKKGYYPLNEDEKKIDEEYLMGDIIELRDLTIDDKYVKALDKSRSNKKSKEDTSDGVVGDNNGDGKIDEKDWEEEWKNYLNKKMN